MRRSVLPALSLALALSACGFSDASDGDAGGSNTTPPSTSSSAAGAGAGVALNERGNIPMQLGEEAAVRPSADADGPPMLTLSLEDVAIDPICDDDSEVPPETGHYVALLLHASVTPEYDPRVVSPISDYDFSVVGPDGSTFSTVSEAGRACFGPPRLIQNMRIGPGYEYEGWMVLDVPVTSGTLVYAPGDDPHGWEWQF